MARLQEGERRHVWRALVESLPLCALLVLGLFCALQVAHLVWGAGPAPVAQYVLFALGAGALAIAAAALHAALRRPSTAAMARTADRTFAFHECISTALEVAAKEPASLGVIGEALLQSAAARAEHIEAGRLVPLRFPRTAFVVPALVLLAALLTAVPSPVLHEALAALRPAVGTDAAQHAAERAEDVATVAALAAIVRRDGRERADPELQAVAQAMSALAQRFAETPTFDREGLTDGMERLLAAANDAYARAGETPPVALNQPRARDSTRRGGTTPAPAGTGRPPTAAAQPEQGAPRSPGQRDGTGGDAPTLPTPERTIAGARPPGGTLDPLADPALAVAAANPEQDYRDLGGEPAEEGGPGEVFGGAAGGAPGDYAGFGTRALTGAPTARLGLAPTGELLLDNPLGEGGRRTRLNLTGQPAEAVITGAPVAGTAWRAAPEHEVTRTALPVTARDLVGRYFQAMTAKRGE